MAKESSQKKIARDRPPRVQITYDVEVGDATEPKELPFVLGVLGDFTGHPKEELPRLKDRKFVQVDHETFDDVLAGMAPHLALKVDNRLDPGEAGLLSIQLEFQKLEDFEPARVVDQVEPLRQILDLRTRLADLKNKLVGNEKLDELLDDMVRDTEKLQRLAHDAPPAQGE